MFTPVDFMSVAKASSNYKSPETAGPIASSTTSSSSIFTNVTETAGSVAYSAPSASGSTGSSICTMA